MAHNVFAPLGMNQTHVCDDHQRIIKDRAWSYRSDPGTKGAFKTVVFPYSGYGAGGIYSTVEDLARWVSNLAKPRAGDERVIQQMLEPGRLNSGQTDQLCVCPGRRRAPGMKRIGHTGRLAGYRAYAGLFPDQDLGVIVLSNLASFPPGKADAARRSFPARAGRQAENCRTDHGRWHPPQVGTARTGAATRSRLLAADELRAYAGAYSSPELDTTYTIVVEKQHLIAKLARNEDVVLIARDKDEFTGTGSFRRDSLRARRAGPDQRPTRLERPGHRRVVSEAAVMSERDSFPWDAAGAGAR